MNKRPLVSFACQSILLDFCGEADTRIKRRSKGQNKSLNKTPYLFPDLKIMKNVCIKAI